ncbi:MAG TPA: hypothetical protein VF141_09050 [Chryseolinea sp.]
MEIIQDDRIPCPKVDGVFGVDGGCCSISVMDMGRARLQRVKETNEDSRTGLPPDAYY